MLREIMPDRTQMMKFKTKMPQRLAVLSTRGGASTNNEIVCLFFEPNQDIGWKDYSFQAADQGYG